MRDARATCEPELWNGPGALLLSLSLSLSFCFSLADPYSLTLDDTNSRRPFGDAICASPKYAAARISSRASVFCFFLFRESERTESPQRRHYAYKMHFSGRCDLSPRDCLSYRSRTCSRTVVRREDQPALYQRSRTSEIMRTRLSICDC